MLLLKILIVLIVLAVDFYAGKRYGQAIEQKVIASGVRALNRGELSVTTFIASVKERIQHLL